MAREVKAQCGLFLREALFHTPGNGGHQVRLLRARAVVVFAAHVKQAGLVDVGTCRCRKVKGAVNRRHHGGAVEFKRVKGTGFDERLQAALVHAAAFHAAAKVKQAGKGPGLGRGAPAFARGDDGLNRLLARAFDGAQAVADLAVRDGLETVEAPVDVGRLKVDVELAGVFKQDLELVGVVHLHRHIGAEKLGRVMHLDPGRVVRQERIGGGVRLVKAVARKLFHQVKHLVGLGLGDVVFGGTGAEDGAVFGHFFGLLFAHGAAQHVGAAQRVATQNLRGLHHLFLVNHDAVGLTQHVGHQRVRVFNDFAPVLARHKARNQVHGAGAVQGVQGNQVFQARGLGVTQHALHAAALELEHGFGLAL